MSPDHTPAAAAASATSPPRRAALALLVGAARPDGAQVVRGAAWLLLAAGLEALTPVLGKFFIDNYLVPRHADLGSIGGLLLAALLAGWSASLLRYRQLRRLAGVATRSVQRLREQVFAHVLRLPMAYFDRAMTGQLVSRVTNDTEAVQQLYVQLLFVLLDSLIMIGTVLLAFALLDARLMGVAALLVPAVLGIVALYRHYSARAVARTRALRGDLNAQVAEGIAGMAVLQASSAEATYARRYDTTNEAHYGSRRAELRANAWLLRPALDLLHVLILVAVIAVYGWRASQAGVGAGSVGAVEVGVLYAFVSTLGRLVEPLIQLTMQFAQLQQSMVAAERLHGLLREPTAPGDASAVRQEVHHGRLDVTGLDFAYSPGRPVLRDINLHIPAGQFVGIVGATGSGKSTLLSLLLRFYRPQHGSLCIDGHPLDTYGEAALTTAIGLVPQDPFLLAESVRSNIAMQRDLSDEAIRAAARDAGAEAFIQRLPQGYDTLLGEGGARLSAGEKQLIAIARALAGRPKILLLDEATSHIDSETEARVQRSLATLRGRMTVIAIAHRLSTIRAADHIVVLRHGHIAEEGDHAALMARDNGLYRRLVVLQQLEEQIASDPPRRTKKDPLAQARRSML